MALTWAKISNESNDLDPDWSQFSYYKERPLWSSPNGNYAVATNANGTISAVPSYLIDTSANPPVLVWQSLLNFDEDPELGVDGMSIFAVDDEGDCWCGTEGSDGKIFKFDKDTQLMTHEYTWTQLNDANPEAHDLVIYRIFTFKLTTGEVKILTIPENAFYGNPWCFLATKGTPGLTNISTNSSPRVFGTGWGVWGGFLDDNDDIWVYGSPNPTYAPHVDTEMILWRITDVGGSPYDDYLSITMPIEGRDPEGYFADGKFIGGWYNQLAVEGCNWYFSVDLITGDLQTRDISETPVWMSGSYIGPIGADWVPPRNTVPNPNHFFFAVNDGTVLRGMRELLPDLSDGLEFSLDDWGADDGIVDDGSSYADRFSIVRGPLYLDTPAAFCGARYFYTDPPPEGNWDNEHSDFYEYYFGPADGESEGSNSDTTLRCWAFSLDGHDFYVLRVGPTATFVYDLTTDQWSHWKSPDFEYLRAHVGQNWIGMTDTLDTFGTDIVGGDDTHGILWILDPLAGEDDNITTGTSSFERKVTGGLALTGRETALCNALTITLALGDPVLTSPTITLRTSDDLGSTWVNHGSVILSTGTFNQVVEWFGLGLMQHPGRLFEISDSGATVRIGRAQIR